MNRPKKILFLTPYPQDTAGSQRFRFEQYFFELISLGYEFVQQSFIDEETWSILYEPGYETKKIAGIIKGYLRRLWQLFSVHSFDYVFIHREATPLGYPIFEFLISKVFRKKIIYDYDDAIWIPNTSAENRLVAWLKFPSKVKLILKWSHRVSAGNQYLANFALKYNSNVTINPTTLDTENRHLAKNNNHKKVVIGWTGTHSTLKYLEIIRQVLFKLDEFHDFEFLIIADKAPKNPLPNQRFIPWNKQSEISDLNLIDIGVMPLENDLWAEGKCGFKALQFMALEKPVLVSPVGVNKVIVEEDKHGFHCANDQDWLRKMELLIQDEGLRKRLGKEGRRKVIEKYSIKSNRDNFLSLFK